MAEHETGVKILEPYFCIFDEEDNDYGKRDMFFSGGRASGKSWGVFDAVTELCIRKKTMVLIVREYLNRIEDSAIELIWNNLSKTGYQHEWTKTRKSIVHNLTGSTIKFSGMNVSPSTIKSFEGADIMVAEEAAGLTEDSMENLVPTIRKPGSRRIWVWNPPPDECPVEEFMESCLPEEMVHYHSTYLDNPFCPKEVFGDAEAMRRKSLLKYRRIWLGEKIQDTNLLCIPPDSYSVKEFDDPEDNDPLFGVDFGFKVDPSVVVRCFVTDTQILVTHCVHDYGTEIDHIPALLQEVPDTENYVLYCDSSRPEIVSYLRRNGFPLAASVQKTQITFGISQLLSKEIVIHPRCELMLDEITKYKYKAHKKTGRPTAIPADEFNNSIDALRYAVRDAIIFGSDSSYGSSFTYHKKYTQSRERVY
ncbi:MAG TPA: PBSX family phage terminase large subunit [Epsilonproteobacteria bacterium]|nr:PBSX family phage terminase large subunit [Campylobacterota bacterium]